MRTLQDFRPYQSSALAFCDRTRRGYLAAKAGAGKTAIVLHHIANLLWDSFEVRRVLVVAPLRVVPQWGREARKWGATQRLRVSTYVGTKQARIAALAADTDVVVVSQEFYAELVQLIKAKDWPFDLVVLDDVKGLRNGGRQGSKAWKVSNAIARKTESRMLILSGSPRPKSGADLFGPVYLLDGGERLGKTLTAFRDGYLEPDKMHRQTGQVYSWRVRPGLEPKLYSDIADLYFAVAPDLGLPYVVVDRPIEMTELGRNLYREMKRDQVIDATDLEVTAGSAGVMAGKLHQLAQGCVYADDGRPAVVHTEKLDELEQIIEEVDGLVIVAIWYQHDRERVLAKFKDAVDITTPEGLQAALTGGAKVAVLHPASAGHGVDGLQLHYSTLIWFAVPYDYELYEQTNARVVRSGQTETVTIYRIVATGTIDEDIVVRLAQREQEQNEFFTHLEEAT